MAEITKRSGVIELRHTQAVIEDISTPQAQPEGRAKYLTYNLTIPVSPIMPKHRIDRKREDRITMEIVVDAYNEEERAMSWYYYLEEQLTFPFEARIRQAMAASPLGPGETVSVTGLAHEDLCRVGIFVWVRCDQSDLVVPLAQLVPVGPDESTREAVADWHYWHDQGYAF